MDPTKALEEICDAIEGDDAATVIEKTAELRVWLSSGGFAPDIKLRQMLIILKCLRTWALEREGVGEDPAEHEAQTKPVIINLGKELRRAVPITLVVEPLEGESIEPDIINKIEESLLSDLEDECRGLGDMYGASVSFEV